MEFPAVPKFWPAHRFGADHAAMHQCQPVRPHRRCYTTICTYTYRTGFALKKPHDTCVHRYIHTYVDLIVCMHVIREWHGKLPHSRYPFGRSVPCFGVAGRFPLALQYPVLEMRMAEFAGGMGGVMLLPESFRWPRPSTPTPPDRKNESGDAPMKFQYFQ